MSPSKSRLVFVRLLFALFVVLITGQPERALATGWDPAFGITAAPNGVVYDIAVMGSDLYIAGDFTTVGGVAANRVAKWNGSSWSALGTGTDGFVWRLLVVGSDLYAGGVFSAAGGVGANRIAKWNGTTWSALGAGVSDGYISTLATTGSDLFVGGSFLTAGGIPVNFIAKWNGSSWSALGDGASNNVGGLAVIGTDLYASGGFTIGGINTGVAKWNGSSWSALSEGATGGVLASIGTDLYVGSGFSNAGGVGANYIKKWNGSSWSALGFGPGNGIGASGGGVYPAVYDILPVGSALYVAGSLTKAGGVAASGVAQWTGSTWIPLDTDDNNYATSIALLGSDLYVAGVVRVDGLPTPYIARWTGYSNACGNGVLETPYEECDDSNVAGGDGCSAECLAECEGGYTGVWVNAGSDELTIIDDGNGNLRGHFTWQFDPEFQFTWGLAVEAVDRDIGMYGSVPGAPFGPFQLSGFRQGCDHMDQSTDSQILPGAWTRISTVVCGDGALDPGEDCDLGATNKDEVCGDAQVETCSYTCQTLPPGISCDDGNFVDGDGCDFNCTPTACGNGVQTAGEACDDENLVGDDGCNQNCQTTQCGDGFLTPGQAAFCEAGEICVDTCDDGWVFPFGNDPLDEGEPYAVLIDGHDYYFGGYFGAGDFLDIARWNNGVWKPLAKGFAGDSAVYALAKHGSKIYAGGEIFADGQTGAPLGRIASWDGSSWSSVGGGVSTTAGYSVVNALLSANAHLYVAGAFDHAGGVAATGVARWDGASWSGFGDLLAAGGQPGGGRALAVIGDDVYVGGGFETAGGVAANNIAKWDGAAWAPLGAGFPEGVTSLATDGTRLYVGGPATIRVWDGAAWTTIWDGSALGAGTVSALVVIGDYLFAGGTHFTIGRATGVARWDGSEWTSLGSGLASRHPEYTLPEVRSMVADGSRLIVAGHFYRAGGKVSSGVAVWTESGCGEACDDGNAANGDGCDNNCRVTACGNGIKTAGEVCDDANLASGDGCDSNCTTTGCGNGIGTAGETCDDGNAVAGDGCESDCRLTAITQVAPPGGTVSTPPATEQFPVQAGVTSPSGGSISISEASSSQAPQGFVVLGTILDITAPDATVADPLHITMTVHLSAVPAGVNPGALGVTRDGVEIADCSGAAGQASPNPCIQSRTVGAQTVEITVLTSHASLWTAVIPSMDEDGRKCLLGATKAAAAVATTHLKGGAKCLKSAESGDADFEECVAMVAGAKTGKAMQKTLKAEAPCDPGVPFGFAGSTTANIAGISAGQLLLLDVLGADIASTITGSPTGAACRKAAAGGIGKFVGSKVSMFLACESEGLSRAADPFVSAAGIEGCLDVVQEDAGGKVGKALATLAKKLGACAPSTLLPGACSGASNVATCLHQRVDCRICSMFRAIAGFERDCDEFDDGLRNASCF